MVAVDTVILLGWSVSRWDESVLEVDTGVKPVRYRAPLRATGLDPRLPLPTEVLHAIDTLMCLTAHRYGWIKGFAGFQDPEA
jgi:hypothetical protein